MNAVKIIGLILSIVAMICILISIFCYSGKNIFLFIGLLCICVNMIMFILTPKNK
ncbi:MAG: hypothetical protein LKI42_03665 [Bacteroidales bacterium]|jgi:hypothetical protein|nr:hypothetical protein [Bacteroidales bacterium]MCI1785986.1 hypothetical protein [Bacteroidales bacterium]